MMKCGLTEIGQKNPLKSLKRQQTERKRAKKSGIYEKCLTFAMYFNEYLCISSNKLILRLNFRNQECSNNAH